MAQVAEQFVIFKVSKLVKGSGSGSGDLQVVLDAETVNTLEQVFAEAVSEIEPGAVVEIEPGE